MYSTGGGDCKVRRMIIVFRIEYLKKKIYIFIFVIIIVVVEVINKAVSSKYCQSNMTLYH